MGRGRQARRLARAVAVASVLALLGSVAPAAFAATLTVSNTNDTGPGSLRATIALANAGDMVVLPAQASHYLVTSGEIPIAVAPLTIQGATASSSVIDASGGSSRVFHVTAAPASSQTITIQGVTITGGHATTMPGGGAILVDGVSNTVGVNLVLSSVAVTNNTATVDLTTGGQHCCGGGGGVYSDGGDISLTNSMVSNNTATVVGSTGSGGPPFYCCSGGGGIYNNSGNTMLTATNVDNNTASVTGHYCCHGGGGIYEDGGTPGNVTISGGEVVSNSFTLNGTQADVPGKAGNCCSGGGALYQDSNVTTIAGVTLSGNEATLNSGQCCQGGGAIYDDGKGGSITSSTLSANMAVVNGPAGANANNHCCSGGGALATFGGWMLSSSTFDSNTSNVTAGDCCHGGGAIQIDAKLGLTAVGTTISNNSSLVSGGTESGGGGVYEDTGLTAVNTYTNSTISDNSTNATNAQNGGGGGLFLLNGSQTSPDVLANATIAGNGASSGAGGGVILDGGKLTAKNSIVALNTAAAHSDCSAGGGSPVFTSLGYNVVTSDNCGFTATGDQLVPASSVGLAPLANNGGPTMTRALTASSPAIDHGNPSGCTGPAASALTIDQRGMPRPDTGEPVCDVGAFELQDAPQLTLTVALAGTGSGSVISSPAGISCPGTCSHAYGQGTVVMVTAAPSSGSTFAGWSGGGCSGTGACTLMLTSGQTVTATFTAVTAGPSCTISASTNRVLLAADKTNGHGSKTKAKRGTLTFVVRCNEAANVQLTGKLTEVFKRKHRKRTVKGLSVPAVGGSVRSQVTSTLTLKLPSSALTALKAGARESVKLTLTATNTNGVGKATLTIARLRSRRR